MLGKQEWIEWFFPSALETIKTAHASEESLLKNGKTFLLYKTYVNW